MLCVDHVIYVYPRGETDSGLCMVCLGRGEDCLWIMYVMFRRGESVGQSCSVCSGGRVMVNYVQYFQGDADGRLCTIFPGGD